MAASIDEMLEIVVTAIKTGAADGGARPPDLRAGFARFAQTCLRDSEGAALLAELDEIVDASNGLAVLVGLKSVDADG